MPLMRMITTIIDWANVVITGGTMDNVLQGNVKFDHNVETLAANKTLVITDKVIQKLDLDGIDRDVLLPAEGDSTDLVFFIYNMGGEVGEDLYIQDDAAGALETIGYNQMGLCTCDGTTWKVICVTCGDGVDTLNLRVKEENTSALVIGQPVYISGATGAAFPNVGLADCSDSTKIRIKGLVAEAISQNSTGYIRIQGLLENVDSTKGNAVNPNSQDWTAGDELWVAATAGGLTNVRPTSGRTIKVGTALTVEGSDSKILVDVRENPVFASAASGEDLVLRMGDSAGVNKVSFRDYANNGVASIDSNGKQTVKGIATETKTDSYTIVAADLGKCLRMNSASDKIFTFPSVGASDDGVILNFENINTGKLTLQMVDSDKIHDSGAACTIYTNDDSTATLSVRYCHATVTWLIINGLGTWVTTN